jgi:hypothetical protein
VTIASALRGTWAALRVPHWLSGERLQSLTRDAGPQATRETGDPDASAAARLTLRILGRLSAGYWRNTCLYRSAAEVLLRRERGGAAVLRLGVRQVGEGIGAHAWVEADGTPVGEDAENAGRFQALAP